MTQQQGPLCLPDRPPLPLEHRAANAENTGVNGMLDTLATHHTGVLRRTDATQLDCTSNQPTCTACQTLRASEHTWPHVVSPLVQGITSSVLMGKALPPRKAHPTTALDS